MPSKGTEKDDRILNAKEAEVFIAQLAYQEYQELKGIDERYKELWDQHVAACGKYNALLESYKTLYEAYIDIRRQLRSGSGGDRPGRRRARSVKKSKDG